MIYKTRTRKRLNLESLFASQSEPESKPLYKYSDGDDEVEILNDTINLVLSRDIQKNVNIAANIAFNVAQENPELDVWYVNTYAGVAMMKAAFTKELKKLGVPIPEPSDVEALPEDDLAEEEEEEKPPAKKIWTDEEWEADRPRREKPWLFAKPGELWVQGKGMDTHNWYRIHTEEEEKQKAEEKREKELAAIAKAEAAKKKAQAKDEDSGAEDPPVPSELLPNLFIHDVPIGTWNALGLGDDIRGRGKKNNHPVVIMNSFEFAPISRGQKDKMVVELIELREKYGLTLVVFSHKMNWDIEAGIPGRGPLGVLAAKAGRVIRLKDPFEHLIRSRNPQKQAGKGIVHEAQMRAPKIKYPTPAERDGIARLREFEDYHADPWQKNAKLPGLDLCMLARTPLLKAYYHQHLRDIFTRGLEPTEYLLASGKYEAMEEKMEEGTMAEW